MSTYSEKLKDPRWQKKRLEVFNRAGWLCQLCGREDKTFHAHHPKYVAGREPWEYDNIICLCEGCHSRVHGEPEKYEDPFGRILAADVANGNAMARAVLSWRVKREVF